MELTTRQWEHLEGQVRLAHARIDGVQEGIGQRVDTLFKAGVRLEELVAVLIKAGAGLEEKVAKLEKELLTLREVAHYHAGTAGRAL